MKYLEKAGFRTLIASDGVHGLELAQKESPSLVVLDIMLPEMDGFEVARKIRIDSDVPIIMLTARDAHKDRVAGLELGADDYMVKPFEPEELVARVKAVLRRTQVGNSTHVRVGDFEIDSDQQRIYHSGTALDLTAQQYAILAAFIRNPNRLLSREQLIQIAFDEFEGFDRAIDSHVRRIRRLIETDTSRPKYLTTVYGAGYRFQSN